jgi:hypothetical protein
VTEIIRLCYCSDGLIVFAFVFYFRSLVLTFTDFVLILPVSSQSVDCCVCPSKNLHNKIAADGR